LNYYEQSQNEPRSKYERIYESDEYLELTPGEVVVESNMLEVRVGEPIFDGETFSGIKMLINQTFEGEFDKERNRYIYSTKKREEQLPLGGSVYVKDLGMNTSDYYVGYAFEFFIVRDDEVIS
jgi:hypothetical protein